MTSIVYQKGDNGIVQLIMDRPTGSANVMDAAFQADFKATVAKIVAEAGKHQRDYPALK